MNILEKLEHAKEYGYPVNVEHKWGNLENCIIREIRFSELSFPSRPNVYVRFQDGYSNWVDCGIILKVNPYIISQTDEPTVKCYYSTRDTTSMVDVLNKLIAEKGEYEVLYVVLRSGADFSAEIMENSVDVGSVVHFQVDSSKPGQGFLGWGKKNYWVDLAEIASVTRSS